MVLLNWQHTTYAFYLKNLYIGILYLAFLYIANFLCSLCFHIFLYEKFYGSLKSKRKIIISMN